jgi:hypothetical protein
VVTRSRCHHPASAGRTGLVQRIRNNGASGFMICRGDMPGGALDELLLAAGETTWTAGPLTKGSNLCHGTGGNGYTFLKLFARARDEKWLARARVRHARDRPGGRGCRPLRPVALFVLNGGSRLCDILLWEHSRSGGVPDPRCFPCPRTSAMNDRFLLAQVTDMHIKAGGKLSYRVVVRRRASRAASRN